MSVITEALDTVREALVGFRVGYLGSTAASSPPAVVIAPPSLVWEGYGAEPTGITVDVLAMVAGGERSTEQLAEHTLAVIKALSAHRGLVVTAADPAVYDNLPAYRIVVDAAP